MILARVAHEHTPNFIWATETPAERANYENIDKGGEIGPLKGSQQYESYMRYKGVKCFDVRPMQNSNVQNSLPTCNNAHDTLDPKEEEMEVHEFENVQEDNCSQRGDAMGVPGTVEELWIVGERQVEWRRGGKTVKIFTGEHIALQALWTRFISGCTTTKSVLDCIVIREKERLRVYSEGGREFLVALPFAVCRVWNTKYGLLLERSTESPKNSSTHGTCASYPEHAKGAFGGYRIKPPRLMALHHPLDDLTRIIVKTGSADNVKFTEWNGSRHKIVFTCANPSICVTFDTITGYHNIWLIRQSWETDEFDQNLITRESTNENDNLNPEEIQENAQTTPLPNVPYQQQPNLISNLLNNTRFKQLQRKQNIPNSVLPSASGSPLILGSYSSPNSARPTPNISANSCVAQQQKSQNSPSLHSSLSGVIGTSTRRHTPVASGTRTSSFVCTDSPMTSQNQNPFQNVGSNNQSTREFMSQHGTPILASNPNVNAHSRKHSHHHLQHGTPSARLMTTCLEGQQHVGLQGVNTGAHHTAQITSNVTTDGNNKFTSSRGFDFGGTDQPLAPDFSLCLDHMWSEERDVNLKMHDGFQIVNDNKEIISSTLKQADKVFLSKDVIGKEYICFLHKSKGVIDILPYHEVSSNSGITCPEHPTTLAFGNLSQIGCMQNQHGRLILDAAPIDSLGMILTLERNENGLELNKDVRDNQQCTNICLYTGSTCQSTIDNKVADVHIEPLYAGIMKKGDLAKRVNTISQLSNIAHEISILHLDGKRENLRNKISANDKRKMSLNEKNSLKVEGQGDLDRKGIVTSSRPPSASGFPLFNESCLSMLSPVAKSDTDFQTYPSMASRLHSKLQTTAENGKMGEKMSSVEYGAHSHVKLCHNGLRFQLTLPPICTSSLVQRCLKSLYAYLPKSVSIGLAVHWYRMRNAPGPSSISGTEEWKLFVKCLLSQMGYRTEKLKSDIFSNSATFRGGNDSSMSPIYPKKMRPDEAGSDEDWQTLLETRPHVQSGQQISFLLGIQDVSKTINQCTKTEETLKDGDNATSLLRETNVEAASIDPNASLFEYIGSILWCLHLLYEDFKLDKASLAYLSPMAMVLSKLAGDLKLVYYIEHYWKDFPMNCQKTIDSAQTGQMLPQFLPVISNPFVTTSNDNSSFITQQTPPCIYSHLTRLIDNSEEHLGLVDHFYILSNGATQKSRDLIIIYAILSLQMKKIHQDCSVSVDTKLKISDYVAISKPSNAQEIGNSTSGFVELIKTNVQEKHQVVAIDVASSIVRFVVDNHYNAWTLVNSFPVVLALPILAAMFECRLNPRLKDSNWAKEVYKLIGRPDLANRCLKSTSPQESNPKECKTFTKVDNLRDGDEGGPNFNSQQNVHRGALTNVENKNGLNAADSAHPNTIYDGLESVESEITRLRWPKDRRLADVRRMLQSARPVIIAVEQRPEMSDHDFLEVQERALQSLCIRTMALPIGRGALSFRTTDPLPTEILPVPKLCLSGRAPPRGATVDMDHIDVVPNMERWPSFHNGVAAGLRIAQGSGISYVDSNWITFNKPKESSTNPNELVEHGGFLMALGLNGQLASLGKLESFDYLIRGNDMISIGILLGTCAAKRGSMDILATKKIATQVEALLPSTATELPLSNTTQVAGLAGLGLLYQGTGHRQMAEVCLGELGRPPGPEMENCTDRESYSLSAGLALGMITLGKGEVLNKGPLSDLRLPETLYHHMVGGPRSPSVYRHRFRSPSSYQIQEGDTINIDITSPGATLALGLMFFNSGNKTYANWMNAPDSQFLLEFVRPDFLMVRTLAKGLIMWDTILPNSSWIDSHVPASIRPYCLRRPGDDISTGQDGSRRIRGAVDYETINQAYCNIVAGAALAMGLRFAGSNNAQAFEVLHRITHRLLAISKRSVAELAGKATIEQTICVLVLSLAIVAAGSGDLEVIRIIRFLRSRVGPKNPTVTYGSHMALHMALGLLFLGGGRYTLSTSPEAVAAMVAAFFPKFPTHSNDNRYHLQALRHLYVLAAEPRLLIPRDIHSGRLVFCHIELELKDTLWYKGCSFAQKAPTFLPELKYLKKVSIKDPRYHEMVFNVDSKDECQEGKDQTVDKNDGNNFAQLQALFKESFGILDIQQKAGSLSYQDDPQGFRSLTGQCLTKDASFQWSISLNSSRLLSTFSVEPAVGTFTNFFIKELPSLLQHDYDDVMKTSAIEQIMGSILYECASQEKLDMLPFYLQIFQDLWEIGRPGQLLLGQQIKILVKLTAQDHIDCCGERGLVNRLVNPEVVTSVYQGLQYKLDFFLKQYGVEIAKDFLVTGKFNMNKRSQGKENEHNFENIQHVDLPPWKRNAFASLLVLHQMMVRNSKEYQDKLLVHFTGQTIKDGNMKNPLQRLMRNKQLLNAK